jgi:hypothetical protein
MEICRHKMHLFDQPRLPADDRDAATAGSAFRIHDFLRALGRGLIIGAADGQPCGIGTYSEVGADFG